MKIEKYNKNNEVHVDALNDFNYSGHPSISIIGYVAPHDNAYILDADIEFKEYLIKKFPELNLDFDLGNGSELKINKNQTSAILTTEWDLEKYTIINFSFKGELMCYTLSDQTCEVFFQVDPSTIKYKLVDDE